MHNYSTQLDSIFPYIVFIYGAMILLVLNSSALRKLGERVVPHEAWERFASHGILAWISFFVGGFWVLENLWFS
jgi:hypothetical protein